MLFPGIEMKECHLILQTGRGTPREGWGLVKVPQLWQNLEDSEEHVTTQDPDSSWVPHRARGFVLEGPQRGGIRKPGAGSPHPPTPKPNQSGPVQNQGSCPRGGRESLSQPHLQR